MIVIQLQFFVESLPETVACTDELGVTLFRDKKTAVKKRYVNPNHPNSVRWLVLDLDREDSGTAWLDANVPPPNMISPNPENGHAHYFYALRTPVHFNPDSSPKAQRYLAAISIALTEALRADPSYSHTLAKNPKHEHWPTVEVREAPYELGELAAHLDLSPRKLDRRTKLDAVSYGRNCTLFDTVRYFAYSAARSPQGWFGWEFWFDQILRKAQAVNATFGVPLDYSEVKDVARKIARYVWNRMDTFGPEGFRAWGDGRRRKSIKVRKASSEELAGRIRAIKADNPEVSNRTIAKRIGRSLDTVNRALRVRHL